MEMCYDGALVMPNNYAVVNEEEMTYVDGGISVGPLYANDATDMYKAIRSAANCMNACAWGTGISCVLLGIAVTAAGTALGGPVGTAVGSAIGSVIACIGGAVGFSLMWSWASAYDVAADQARQLGHSRCVFEAHTEGFTMIASVKAC